MPRTGDLYWVLTAHCWADPKPRRPVVVIRPPMSGVFTEALVVARTSDVDDDGKGVFHAAIPGTSIDVDGKFMKKFEHFIDERLFGNGTTTSYVGMLDTPTLDDVISMMGY